VADAFAKGRHRTGTRHMIGARARMAESRPKTLDLPSLEDPNGVQLAIMKLAQWLIDGEVDAKRAGTITYMIQTAASNVGRVNFEKEEELTG
jgi:hypothetical protein